MNLCELTKIHGVIYIYQTENKTLTEALSKLTSRLEKLEKKPTPKVPLQGAHPPKEGDGEAPTISRAEKKKDVESTTLE